jgi:phage terminase small subunit
MDKLTEKQKAFCREYILDWNGTQAAIRAGYSANSANEISSQNLAKLNVQEYIRSLQKEIEKVAGVSQLMVLNEHKKLAFSSIAHLHNTWIERKQFDKLTDEQKSCISEITTQVKSYYPKEEQAYEVEFVKIKLYDKQKALDSISKMLGYDAAQKIDHSNKDGSLANMFKPFRELKRDERDDND